MKNKRDSMVAILFTEPVLGPDPRDSGEFLSNKHWLEAAYCIQNGQTTSFIDFEGEVLSEWKSSTIQAINWPKDIEETAEVESGANRYNQIKGQYPNFWTKWLDSEDDKLRSEFEQGLQLEQICQSHQRAPGGIVSRLRKLGLVGPIASTTEVEEILNSRRMALILHEDLGAVEDRMDGPEDHVSLSVTELPRKVVPAALHKFFYYDSAGVTRKTRIMNNVTGSCSCGGWQTIMGSVGSLRAAWQEHVNNVEVRGSNPLSGSTAK